MSQTRILIVDDEKLILISTRIVLESVGYAVAKMIARKIVPGVINSSSWS